MQSAKLLLSSALQSAFRLSCILITEFQRLKEEEQKQLGWTAKRELAKLNYHMHTDAIKHKLIPKELSSAQTSIIYANVADVLNVAMSGMTAKPWREAIPNSSACAATIRTKFQFIQFSYSLKTAPAGTCANAQIITIAPNEAFYVAIASPLISHGIVL